MGQENNPSDYFLRALRQPNFLWGVALGLLGAIFWVLTSFGQWSRQDERFQTELRYMSERVARLETARDEAAVRGQAEALRDAEFRTKTEQALNTLRDTLIRIERARPPPLPDSPIYRPQRWPFIPNFDIIPREREATPPPVRGWVTRGAENTLDILLPK